MASSFLPQKVMSFLVVVLKSNISLYRRGLAMRILSVCLSVRLSVKLVHCDKTEERSVQIFIPHEI